MVVVVIGVGVTQGFVVVVVVDVLDVEVVTGLSNVKPETVVKNENPEMPGHNLQKKHCQPQIHLSLR